MWTIKRTNANNRKIPTRRLLLPSLWQTCSFERHFVNFKGCVLQLSRGICCSSSFVQWTSRRYHTSCLSLFLSLAHIFRHVTLVHIWPSLSSFFVHNRRKQMCVPRWCSSNQMSWTLVCRIAPTWYRFLAPLSNEAGNQVFELMTVTNRTAFFRGCSWRRQHCSVFCWSQLTAFKQHKTQSPWITCQDQYCHQRCGLFCQFSSRSLENETPSCACSHSFHLAVPGDASTVQRVRLPLVLVVLQWIDEVLFVRLFLWVHQC